MIELTNSPGKDKKIIFVRLQKEGDMSAVKGFFRIYNGLEKWTMIIMMMVMVIVIFAQVFTRYVMGAALYWSEELGKFIFVWVSWLGVSAGIHTREHIQVKLLPDYFRKKEKWRIEKINYIIIDTDCRQIPSASECN